ncbi:MAG: ABC transporter substrate-binding protein [Pseudomonadota bacterium]
MTRLTEWMREGKLPRREFIRQATLLGLAAPVAYNLAGLSQPARAQDLPRGGTLTMAMRVMDISNPHAISFDEGGFPIRVCVDHLTRTGQDNITRPWLLQGWEASEDLRTWTLSLRSGVSWANGRLFTAEDVAWNVNRVLDPATGSSILGLMSGYMLNEVETDEVDEDGNPVMTSVLWDANAIEVVDDTTVRLNLKVAETAVPEHLFHFPFYMLDPEEGGTYGVGSNGTGPYTLVEHAVGEIAVMERRPGEHYSGQGYLDRIVLTDLGEDSAAALGALLTEEVDGIYEMSETQAPMVAGAPHLTVYRANTALTAVARGKVTEPPFDDPRIMLAMRHATDPDAVLSIALRGNGGLGDHTHVSPIHPEWADLGGFAYNPERAAEILAEAGYPDGIDLEMVVKTQPAYELDVAQVMVESWAQAGIRVTLQTLPASSFWDRWTEYPFSLTAWGHRPLGPMVLGLAYRTGVPWNESSFSNARFDELLVEIGGTVDPDERQRIMGELMTIMREEGPIAQPFFMQVATAFNNRVLGVEMHPTKFYFFDEVAVQA